METYRKVTDESGKKIAQDLVTLIPARKLAQVALLKNNSVRQRAMQTVKQMMLARFNHAMDEPVSKMLKIGSDFAKEKLATQP